MTVFRSMSHWLRCLAGSSNGSISIELAVTLSLITAMVIPIVDIGMGAYTQMQVQNAAQAGAEYAAVKGASNWNATNVATAVTSASSLNSISASPAPSESCACVTNGALTTVICGSTCGNSEPAGTFATVNAKATYSTLFKYPGIPNPMNLTATSTVRIQ